MPETQVPESPRGETICTLYDGDYHFGLGALTNSLHKGGYKGTIWAGYRGSLPPWTKSLQKLEAPGDQFLAGPNIRLVFILVETKIHLSLYKPQFMKRLLEQDALGATYLWFLDADMYLRGGWGFFEQWARWGVAAVQDINYRTLPATDPLRRAWTEIAAGMGLANPRPLEIYCNGGLCGLAAEHKSFLDLWIAFIAKAGELGMDLTKISSGSRDMPFHIPDQDALNCSLMFTEHPISQTGPEVMGFLPGRSNLYHNVGPKPWRGSMLTRALKGVPPSRPSKFFFNHVETPIQLFTPGELKKKKFEMAIGAMIGRFYSRR